MRARIAAPIDDDRRPAVGENLRAGVLGVAVEIDQNVDLVVGDLLAACRSDNRADVAPLVEPRPLSCLRRDRPCAARRNNRRRSRPSTCRAVRTPRRARSRLRVRASRTKHNRCAGACRSRPSSAARRPNRPAFRAADERLVVHVRLGELEHRIVGISGERDRRNRVQHLFGRRILGRAEMSAICIAAAAGRSNAGPPPSYPAEARSLAAGPLPRPRIALNSQGPGRYAARP